MYTKLVHFIETVAVKFAVQKSIAQQYGIYISVLILAAIFTSIVNAYNSSYLLLRFTHEYGVSAYVASAILIIIFEVLTIVSLFIGGKFLALRLWTKAIFPIFMGAIFFAANFWITTTSLAEKESNKIDKTVILQDFEAQNIEATNLNFQLQIENIQKLIDFENQNKQGWKDGKRISLTDEQLLRVQDYQTQILEIRSKQDKKILELKADTQKKFELNNNEVAKTAKNYYLFASFMLFLQLFSNMGIAFFFVEIWKEKHKDQYFAMLIANSNAKTEKQMRKNNVKKLEQANHDLQIAIEMKAIPERNNSDESNEETEPETGETQQAAIPEILPVTETQLYKNNSIGFHAKKHVETVVNSEKLRTPVNSAKLIAKDVNKQPVTPAKKVNTTSKNVDFGFAYCAHCQKQFKRNAINAKFCTPSHRVMFDRKAKKQNENNN